MRGSEIGRNFNVDVWGFANCEELRSTDSRVERKTAKPGVPDRSASTTPVSDPRSGSRGPPGFAPADHGAGVRMHMCGSSPGSNPDFSVGPAKMRRKLKSGQQSDWDRGYGVFFCDAVTPRAMMPTLEPVFVMRIPIAVVCFGCAMTAVVANANAGLLYGVDNVLHNLYTVDSSTGELTVVGSLGFNSINSLALHPGSGALYGIDTATKNLVTIDRTTGATTVIGTQTLGDRRLALAFDADGNLFSLTAAPVDLVTIDITTAVATSIGPNNGGF
ncbi:MAG: hypothetical protein KDA60_11490, partial [Planctomycetales bacterium]|nr:hypothetical protein [Planctomycetales bacterium]